MAMATALAAKRQRSGMAAPRGSWHQLSAASAASPGSGGGWRRHRYRQWRGASVARA